MGSSNQTSESVDAIEVELMTLVRHLETFGRRKDLYERLDRAGYLALRTLDRLGPTTPQGLAQALHMDASTVTRQAATLRTAGFVDRQPDPGDGRSCTLAVTAEGHQAMSVVEQERQRRIQDLVRGWSGAERRDLARILAKLNASLVDAVSLPSGERPSG